MKRVTLIICFCFMSYYFYAINSLDLLTECIKQIPFTIENKDNKALVFIRGNYGHIWSYATKIDDFYVIYSGTTREPSDIHTDTIFNNDNIIKWGLDSLETLYTDRGAISIKNDSFVYTNLYLLINDNKIIEFIDGHNFLLNRQPEYINNKLRNLIFLMYWYASPINIRKYMLPLIE